MLEKGLKCSQCTKSFPLTSLDHCPSCQGVLEVIYQDLYYDLLAQNYKNTRDLLSFLPVDRSSYLYLGQGDTAIVKSKVFENTYYKCEFMNPTGSFKDRPVSVGVSRAFASGAPTIVIASSGNGAASAAAYAASCKIRCILFVPETTPSEKIQQASFYGAKVIKVKGPYSNAFKLAQQCSNEYQIPNITTTFVNPYTVEGNKLVAFELINQLDGLVPDYIFVPIGAGPLLAGIYRGYKDLTKASITSELPRMVGVQAEGCNPIYQAYIKNELVKSYENPTTVAGGIADGLSGYEQDGQYIVSLLHESRGFSDSIDDNAILTAQRELALTEGLFVEPSSASAIASVKALDRKEETKKSIKVVILTGMGLKDMGVLDTTQAEPDILVSSLDDVKSLNIF